MSDEAAMPPTQPPKKDDPSMQMQLWQILVLAVVQGVTEFLPISSSGHLVVVAALISPQDASRLDVSDVNIVLHLGTLAAIIVFYWQRIMRLFSQDRRLVGLLIAGTIPAVIVGLPLKKYYEHVLSSPGLAGVLLIATGGLLLATTRVRKGDREYQQLTLSQAVLIGAAQAVAILPGLSRSGTTIAAGLGVGLRPSSAATFSFLLAIPAIAGAGVLESLSLMGEASLSTPPIYLLIGAFVAFVVGLFSLRWLIGWLEKGRLSYFAWWCIPLGVIVLVWQTVQWAN